MFDCCLSSPGGAYEVKDHPFFQNLDMDNLLSEVPLYIPKLEYGDTCSEHDGDSTEEEESDLDENSEDEENFKTESFTCVAFRFRRVRFYIHCCLREVETIS